MIVNTFSTLREPPELPFEHEMKLMQSTGDPALVNYLGQIMGVACDHGRRPMTPKLYGVMRHLERTRHHLRFQIDPDEMNGLAVWGWESNAILLLSDQSIRDPAGRILVHADTGESEGNATVPYPIDAIARAGETREALSAMGIETVADLPPVMGIGEVVVRPDDEVGWRTLALFIAAVRAESMAAGKPIAANVLKSKSPMAFEALSPRERQFLETDEPSQQTIIDFAWRYEALYLLQWALGFHAELKFANEICDVPLVAQTMVDRPDREIVTTAKLRPATEILDVLDMNQRLLSEARQSAIRNETLPAGIDGGVLSERQHALNWLIQLGGAAWDDVDTPT